MLCGWLLSAVIGHKIKELEGMSYYFSDRENGPVPRVDQSVSPVVWAGVVALVHSLVRRGAFAVRSPSYA